MQRRAGPLPSRRQVLAAAAFSFVAGPHTASAGPPAKVYRVGLVSAATPLAETVGAEPINASARAFVHGLRALGYVEGRNLILERRSAESRFERFGEIVAELVRLKADVIVTANTPAARAAKAVTKTVPIVMANGFDPVVQGVVESLARPGGNVTGLTLEIGPGIEAKRLQLLKAMLPAVSRVGYLSSKESGDWEARNGASVGAAAQSLGLTLHRVEHLPGQYQEAFAQIERVAAEAVFVASSATAYAEGRLIVGFANRSRLPATFAFRESVEAGGLMSYGVNVADNFRRAAYYVDRILKGARPADLPIEQPTRLELLINLRTAKEFGVTVPPSLLLRADEVIS
jgi:putative ABC transport system substrate-binding protein